MNPAAFQGGERGRTKRCDDGSSLTQGDFGRAGACWAARPPKSPGFPGEINFFEVFATVVLTLEVGRGYTAAIDGDAADAAGAVRTFLSLSGVLHSDGCVGARLVRLLRL